jgi:hypothetical protein
MKLAEAFAKKTYRPRIVDERQLKKAKQEFMPKLETFVQAQLQEIWYDLYDRGEMNQRHTDWVRSLIDEGALEDVIVDFLDFRAEIHEIAKSVEEDFG